MELTGQNESVDTLLLAGIMDRLSLLVWAKTKDAQKGINKPSMMVDRLIPKEPEKTDIIAFGSGEEFEKTRKKIIETGG